MAKLVTECPHCSARYELSEAQYAAARGMVRCGRCRQPFRAEIIEEVEQQTPKAPPDTLHAVKVEPEMPAPKPADKEASNFTTQLSVEYTSHLEATSSEQESTMSVDEILANINAKEERRQNLENRIAQELAKENTGSKETNINAPKLGDKPLKQNRRGEQRDAFEELNSTRQLEADSDSASETDATDEELISQVDTLIEDKLIASSKLSDASLGKEQPHDTQEDSELFVLEHKHGPNRLFTLPSLFVLFLAVGFLLASLAYQLWAKQWLVFSPNSEIERGFSTTASELNERLSESGYELETRRDLSKLELISAKTEAHASRSTTILLRVSLMNHADIAQPLPWLQLSLTDENGKIVSRRSLRPSDYIYNNATKHEIGARELKKFTIEFLAFPKSATGYELRMLNR